jgi:hypothetical protein
VDEKGKLMQLKTYYEVEDLHVSKDHVFALTKCGRILVSRHPPDYGVDVEWADGTPFDTAEVPPDWEDNLDQNGNPETGGDE